jgi:para-nitrobenzyl esterase
MTALQTTISITTGAVSGTATGTGVNVYRGIPFAAPPVGPLRWRPPQPPHAWAGVHDGSQYGYDPMQIMDTSPMRRSLAPGVSEDCLTLNVWAPAETPAGGAPVIVWFDGGGFISGSASRELIVGTHYAERGAVFVTANYRVGVFGFLAHPLLSAESEHHVSGNYGFLDTIAALQWVRDNIAAFGGNPARVTIMGGSAGAALGVSLLTSPLATGLIHGAIMVSPGAFRPDRTLPEAEAAGKIVGDDLATMRALPADELLKLNAKVDPGLRGLLQMRCLRPIVDGWAIPHDQAHAYRNGEFTAVPTIIGTNANEGGYFAPNVPVKTADALREYLAENFGAFAGEALTHYGASNDGAVLDALAGVWGDAMFNYGVRNLAREIAKRQPHTYRYVLAHAGKYLHEPPVHGDDITYVFGSGDFEPRDRAVSDAIVTAFVHFAAGGDPNGPGAPAWTAYDPERENYLAFAAGFPEGAKWRAASSAFIERYYRALAT